MLSRSLTDNVYELQNNASLERFPVYCHMSKLPDCEAGGWTLVMKVDGHKVKRI